LAVVKSPKNVKRKFLWIKKYNTNNKLKIILSRNVSAHSKNNFFTKNNLSFKRWVKLSTSPIYYI